MSCRSTVGSGLKGLATSVAIVFCGFAAVASAQVRDPCVTATSQDFVTMDVAYDCYRQFNASLEYRREHVENLKRFVEAYPFADLAGGSENPLFPSRIPIVSSLDSIADLTTPIPTSLFAFHSRISLLVRSLNDAHFGYFPSCFGAFDFIQPWHIAVTYPITEAGQGDVSEATRKPVVRVVGPLIRTVPAFWTEALGGEVVGRYSNWTVKSIDGVDAVQAIVAFATRIAGFSRTPESNFNRVLLRRVYTAQGFVSRSGPFYRTSFLGHDAATERTYVLSPPRGDPAFGKGDVTLTVPWAAVSNIGAAVASSKDFYDRLCAPRGGATAATRAAATRAAGDRPGNTASQQPLTELPLPFSKGALTLGSRSNTTFGAARRIAELREPLDPAEVIGRIVPLADQKGLTEEVASRVGKASDAVLSKAEGLGTAPVIDELDPLTPEKRRRGDDGVERRILQSRLARGARLKADSQPAVNAASASTTSVKSELAQEVPDPSNIFQQGRPLPNTPGSGATTPDDAATAAAKAAQNVEEKAAVGNAGNSAGGAATKAAATGDVNTVQPLVADANTAFYLLDRSTGVWVFPTVAPDGDFNEVVPDWLGTIVGGLRALEARGVKRLLIDVSSNGGGYSCIGDALAEYILADSPAIIDQVRLTPTMSALLKANLFGPDMNGILPLNSTSILSAAYTQTRGGVTSRLSGFFQFDCRSRLLSSLPRLRRGWKPEDVAIVSDGGCGSACACMIRSLRDAHKVRAFVYGGSSGAVFTPTSFEGGVVNTFDSIVGGYPQNVDELVTRDERDLLPRAFSAPTFGAIPVSQGYSRLGRFGTEFPVEWVPQPADAFLNVAEPWDRLAVWRAAGEQLRKPRSSRASTPAGDASQGESAAPAASGAGSGSAPATTGSSSTREIGPVANSAGGHTPAVRLAVGAIVFVTWFLF
ncbi:hypothetical protein HDU96_001437 [Phlyctochytrium bullatum]|nr:hypothetical protein HDU96_001437 [Phlyctochytrium bullatum]